MSSVGHLHACLGESHGFYLDGWINSSMDRWMDYNVYCWCALSGPTPNLLGIWPQSPRKDPAAYNKGFEASPLTAHIKHFYRPQLQAVSGELLPKKNSICQTTDTKLGHVVVHVTTFSWEGTTPSEEQFLLPEDEITQGESDYVSAKSLWEHWRCAHSSRHRHASQGIDSWDKWPVLLRTELIIMQSSPSPLTLGFCHVSRGSGINTDFCSVCKAAKHGNAISTLNVHPGSLGLNGRWEAWWDPLDGKMAMC